MTKIEFDEQRLFEQFCLGDKKAYTRLFQFYYKNLVLFAGGFIHDVSVCEDIVQTIFIKLWVNRNDLAHVESLRSYLLKSTQNSCITHLRHKKVRSNYGDYIFSHAIDECYNSDEYILHSELNDKLNSVLDGMSPLHRNCFVMSRIEGKRYAEIAETLNVSTRTIELKIAETLKVLKIRLNDFFSVLFL